MARSSKEISGPSGFATQPAGRSSRTGWFSVTFFCETIPARVSAIKVWVIEPISKIESVFAEPNAINSPVGKDSGIAKLVPEAPDGVGELSLARPIHLVTNIFHVDIHDVAGRIVRSVPHLFK